MEGIEGIGVIGVQQRPVLLLSPVIVENNSQLAL